MNENIVKGITTAIGILSGVVIFSLVGYGAYSLHNRGISEKPITRQEVGDIEKQCKKDGMVVHVQTNLDTKEVIGVYCYDILNDNRYKMR